MCGCQLQTNLNEQAEKRLDIIMGQMKIVEGVTEELKAKNQWEWVQKMTSIRYREKNSRYLSGENPILQRK